MKTDIFETVNKAGKEAFEAAQAIATVNQDAFKELLEKHMEVSNQVVELGVAQMKAASENKDPKTAAEAQMDLIRKGADQALANVNDFVKIMEKSRAAYNELFDKGIKQANEIVERVQNAKAA